MGKRKRIELKGLLGETKGKKNTQTGRPHGVGTTGGKGVHRTSIKRKGGENSCKKCKYSQ